jgi:hypothetical protein
MSASPPVPASFDPSRFGSEAGGGRAPAPGPVFVSRSAEAASQAGADIRDSAGLALPTLRDTRVRMLIAFTLLLQLFAWWRVDGYQLADSVEFMERALTFVRGEAMIDAGAIRPFGFSFFLVPFFAIADWFGIHDLRAVVWCVVVFQMVLGCALVYRCMRLGARFASRTGALAAGFLVATNPVFLQYSTQPVSDIAAAVCVAIALEGLLERGPFRRALISGLWLGLAFMIAYKTLLVSLALIFFIVLRDRFKQTATWRGLILGVVCGLFVQSTFDWIMYDRFGASVVNYVVLNTGNVLTSNAYRLYGRTHWKWVYELSRALYQAEYDMLGVNKQAGGTPAAAALQSPYFYLIELPSLLVWPAIVVGLAAVWRSIVQPNWKSGLLLGVVLLSVYLMSHKGSKDLRLLLPLLPFVVPLLAWGWDGAARRITRQAALTGVFAVATVVFTLMALTSVNVRHFGGYWRAIDYVSAMARASYSQRAGDAKVSGAQGEIAPLRVGCAYHWAVFQRQSPLVDVVKLPWQLNAWKQYKQGPDGGRRETSDDFAAIEELDVFVVHLPILSNNPDLMSWIGLHFEVVAAFYDQSTYEELGPIFILQRRTGSPRARTFFEVTSGVDADRFRGQHELGPALDFVDTTSNERLQFLGVEYGHVPPEDFGWITYHWRALTKLEHDYTFLDRLTSPDERNVWDNNHAPAYGVLPTSSWAQDDIVSESFLVVAAHEPFKPQGRYRPIGGAYRRGDLIPVRSWMKVRAYDPASLKDDREPVVLRELEPARPGETTPIRAPTERGEMEMQDGIQFSADDFVRIGGFFVPVHRSARLPDDGKPVQD